MTVKELREELEGLDENLELYLQIDSEGNGYNKVRGVDGDYFFVDGECLSEDDLEYLGHSKEEAKKIAVVYP